MTFPNACMPASPEHLTRASAQTEEYEIFQLATSRPTGSPASYIGSVSSQRWLAVRRRRLAVAFIAGGSVLTTVGALGLAFGWASSSTTTRPTTVQPADASGTPTTAEGQTAFFAQFVSALRQADTQFLLDRLDPAVLARFSLEQCRSKVNRLLDPNADLRLDSVAGPAPFRYAAGGPATDVSDTYSFTVSGTLHGTSATRVFHFPFAHGRFHVLVDCSTSGGDA
jgi:hypothetical protein